MKTNHEVVADCNELARLFYESHGYQVCEAGEGYRFDKATHPQERSMWNLAVIAYEHIEGTDPEDALRDLEN